MKATLLDLLGAEIIRPLVTALGHSIWQSAIAALLLVVAFRVIGIKRPAARYTAALVALGGCMVAFLITFASLRSDPAPGANTVLSQTSVPAPPTTAAVILPAADSPPATYSLRPHQLIWETPVFCIWIVGVFAFLLRTLLSHRAVRKLRRTAKPVTSPAIHDLLAAIQIQLGALRPVLLLQCTNLRSPAVAGFFRPVIFLPATMLTGCDEVTLRAILAHEVAHLRRHDYLVNLAQRVVESLFFFSPAIWWISRQLREEREAACDKLAAEVLGSQETYASSLLAWSETSKSAAPALTLAADGNRATQLGARLRRLLGAPETRIPCHLLLLGTMIALLGVVAVRMSANADEWHETLTHLRGNFIEEKPKPKALTTRITGSVVGPNGQPPVVGGREDYVVWVHSQVTKHGFSYENGRVSHPGKFNYSPTKQAQAFAWFKGYAPLLTAPFVVDTEMINEGFALQLDHGFSYHVQVKNPQGKPVDNANVTYDYDYVSAFSESVTTDRTGRCTIHNVADAKMRIHVRAAGFEQYSSDFLAPEEDGTCFISLKPAAQAIARIRDGSTGLPISGATVKILGSSAPGVATDKETVISNSGGDGVAILPSFVSGAHYTLTIEAEGYRGEIVAEVRPGSEIDVELFKLQTYTLRIEIPKSVRRGGKDSLRVTYELSCEYPAGKGSVTTRLWTEVAAVPLDQPSFDWEITPPFGRQWPECARVVTHYPGDHSMQVAYPPIPDSNEMMKIRLPEDRGTIKNQMKEREVVVRAAFLNPGAEDTFRLNLSMGNNRATEVDTIAFTEGEARFETVTPNEIHVWNDRLSNFEPSTSWIDLRKLPDEIPDGTGPFIIDLGSVHSTGAAIASVDTKTIQELGPAVAEHFSIRACTALPGEKNPKPHGFRQLKAMPEQGDTGRFLFPPVPLGSIYYMLYQSGNTIIEGEKFELTAKQPIGLTIFSVNNNTAPLRLRTPAKIPPDVDLESLKLLYTAASEWRPEPGQNGSYSLESLQEMRVAPGVIEFPGINWNNPGQYTLTFKPGGGFESVSMVFTKPPTQIVEGLFVPSKSEQR